VLEKGVDDVLILFTQDGARRVHKLTAGREEWPESLKKPELLCGARSDGHLGLMGFDFGKRAQQAGGGARGIEQDGCKRAAVVLVPCRWLQRIAAEHGDAGTAGRHVRRQGSGLACVQLESNHGGVWLVAEQRSRLAAGRGACIEHAIARCEW
jgi:hypothetical protein